MSVLQSVQEFNSAADLRAHYAGVSGRFRSLKPMAAPEPVLQVVEAPPVVAEKPRARWTTPIVPEWLPFMMVMMDGLRVIQEAEKEGRGPSVTPVKKIMTHVAAHYGVPVNEIKAGRRTKTVVRPRQVAMYLARTMTIRSMPEIGRAFGGRDHTTVLHAVRKITALVKTDHDLAAEIEQLRAELS